MELLGVVDEDGIGAFKKGFEGGTECQKEDRRFCDGIGGLDEFFDDRGNAEYEIVEEMFGVYLFDFVDVY